MVVERKSGHTRGWITEPCHENADCEVTRTVGRTDSPGTISTIYHSAVYDIVSAGPVQSNMFREGIHRRDGLNSVKRLLHTETEINVKMCSKHSS